MSTSSSPTSALLVAIDTETTGLNVFDHAILSVAIAPIDRSLPDLSLYIALPKPPAPGYSWHPWAYENYKRFEQAHTRFGISPAWAVETITTYIRLVLGVQEVVLVGHNVGFDVGFLRQLEHRAGAKIEGVHYRSVDTFTLLHNLYCSRLLPSNAVSLSGACRFFDVSLPEQDRHTTLGDAVATAQLYAAIRSRGFDLEDHY